MVVYQCGKGTWTSRLSLRRSLSEGLSKAAMPQTSVRPELPCSTLQHVQSLGLGQSRQQECLTEPYGEHHRLHLDWWLPRSLYIAVRSKTSQISCSSLAFLPLPWLSLARQERSTHWVEPMLVRCKSSCSHSSLSSWW